uniref:PCI domain-containing protein n=1 Tax=Glossina brevipalpis TaxID=37001 RepID=A0A1A9W8X7_9MUSC
MADDILMKSEECPPIGCNENARNQLQQFCLLAKSATGVGLLELIKQVLEAPNIYVFGEFLVMPHIKELETGENAKYYNTLNLFAYGTYKQYRQKSEDYLDLTEAMKKKLQHLTIVSLAIRNKCIPYEVLLNELEITHVRHLEDVIIEATYAETLQIIAAF